MKILRNNRLRLAQFCLLLICLTGGAAAQVRPDAKAALANFEKNIEDGKFSEVENELFKYVVANPKDAKGFSLLGRLRFKQNRLNEAKSLLNKALALDPALLAARLTLAEVDFQSGETQPARAIVDGIGENELADPASRLAAAETAARVGNCPKALSFAEKLAPAVRNGRALPLRAACYLESGDTKNFSLLVPAAKTLARQNPKAAVDFAGVLIKAAKYRETIDLLRPLAAAAPPNAEALLLLTKAEIFSKDFPNAKIHLAQAEKIEPKPAELLFVKSLLESEQGNNAGALEFLAGYLAENSDDTPALSRFVVVALRANQAGKAVRAAEKLLDLQPGNPDFLYLYGIASLQNNDVQKAEPALRKFLEARPSDSLGCLALGLTLAAQPDKIREARAQLEQCLASNPNNFEAAYQLGLSYKVQGETVKAIEYLERTVGLAPNYAAALRDLGTVYLQAGEEAKARPVLEKAVALDPNDADGHFQLSRLYNLIGERELGKRELELFQKLKSPKKDGM
ncbi:MAG: tetratricopeptide repeat protein [Acidobacteria bacterium]|nr:tetratricopeptide repeat protein [Acidobacteriota bacterium]